MEWLGFLIVLATYICIYLTYITGRSGYTIMCVWLIPIFSMVISYQSGMEINGLMVLICFGMFFVCRNSYADVKMWNVKKQKKNPVGILLLFAAVFAAFFYTYAQAQIQGYMLNIQGWGSEEDNFWPMVITIIPMLLLTIPFTQMAYTAIDRIFCKRENITLLECQFYITNENGVESSVAHGYFLEGIQNGITYHFRMTRRMYYLLRKEKWLKLRVRTGLLGGQYVTTFDTEPFIENMKRRDRNSLQVGFVGLLLTCSWATWFFFY